MVSIGSLIPFLALLILLHQNANATKGYQLRSLERERTSLLLEQEVLNMQIAEAQALESLRRDRVIQVMVPFRSPRYTGEDSAVALMGALGTARLSE